MVKECPNCGAPLNSSDFCDLFCKEKPKFPPPRPFVRDADALNGIGAGRVSSRGLCVLKRYQFEQQRNDNWISREEIIEMVFEALKAEDMLGGDGLKGNVESFTCYVDEVLEKLDELEFFEIEPTAWDLYQAEHYALSAVRVGPGRWMALGGLTKTGLGLLIRLLCGPWASMRTAAGVASFAKLFAKVFVVLPPETMEFQVFESIYRFSGQVRVVDRIAHERNYSDGFGKRGPTTEEVVAATAG